MSRLLVVICALMMIFGLTPFATAVLIDFEDLAGPSGTPLPDGYAGLTWETNPSTDDWSIFTPPLPSPTFPDPHPANGGDVYVMAGSEGGGASIGFSGPVFIESISLAIRDRFPNDPNSPSVMVDLVANGTTSMTVTIGPGGWQEFTNLFDSASDIESLEFRNARYEGSEPNIPQIMVDNLDYDSEDADQVPEPGTLLLLGSGLIGVGVFGRKKLFKR